MKSILTITVLVVLLSGCATQIALQDPATRELTRADAEVAQHIAEADGDVVAATCWKTLILYLQPASSGEPIKTIGVLSEFQRLRMLRRHAEDRAVPEDVHVACSPLVVDAQGTLLKFGARVLGR